MIGGSVGKIVKRFACDCDDVLLANFERVSGFDNEGDLLRCPTKHYLPNLTPFWANWDFGANRSNVVSGGIRKGDMNVAVRLHFCVNNAPSERVPFLFGRHSRFCVAR